MSQYTVPPLTEAAGRVFLWEYLFNHPAAERSAAMGNPEELAFLGFCVEHLPHSHAQLLQDLFVLHRTKSKRDGFFVEFGATDGVDLIESEVLNLNYWTAS